MKTLDRLCSAFLLALIACFAASAVAAHKPNIILVMPDDVGYGDYASLGNPIIRTPSVDAFKKQSLLFTQFHVSPNVTNIPKINPLKELYWKQFGGGPDEAMLRKMDPTKGNEEVGVSKKERRKKRDPGAPEDAAK